MGCQVLTHCFAEEPSDAKAAPEKVKPVKLTAQQRKMAAGFEKAMITKFNSKESPGDRETWYVIVGVDQVQAVARGSTGGADARSGLLMSTTYTQTQATDVVTPITVKGRKAAAAAAAQFLTAPNAAVAKLRPTSIKAANTKIDVAGGKQWDFRAFKTEAEALDYAETVKSRSQQREDE
jgi:hypothetical protein